MRNTPGANDGDRTRDNRYHKPALYQLSYVRHKGLGDLDGGREQGKASRLFLKKSAEKLFSCLVSRNRLAI